MNNVLAPKVVLNEANFIGEGILWHSDYECLYWTDIPNCKIFKYTPSTRTTSFWETDSSVGGFTIHEDGRLLLFMDEGAIKLWMDGKYETVIESIEGMEGNRFNDVIADPNGRVFCGVMSTSKSQGWVYRLDTNKSLRKVIYNTGTANGMGFSNNEELIHVCNGLRRWIAPLLSLSANSPFFNSTYTGFKSSRTIQFGIFPRTGIPQEYKSYRSFEDVVSKLEINKSIAKPRHLWWKIRPHMDFGTIEFRMFDIQRGFNNTFMLASRNNWYSLSVRVRAGATVMLSPV